jgi:para-aminobenzoate synthetase/4-amino-4-deoxychorismate lyase
MAASAISSDDPFLCHKTTHRETYDRHRAAHPDVFDVLLWNERGELTEFTIGNVVVELDGARWTPPVQCGLLGGVFRNELLETGAVHERILRPDDARCASRIWLVNSLREWVEVRLEEEE